MVFVDRRCHGELIESVAAEAAVGGNAVITSE